jgi:hypothetical protein
MSSRGSPPAVPATEVPSSESAAVRIKESLELLVSQLCDPVREELDALRARVDERLAAVAASLASRDHHGELLDTLVLDLSGAAADQAEAAASRARLESREEAQTELAAAQAAAQTRLDAEVAANAALRQSLDDARQQLDTIQAEAAVLQAARIEIESRLDQAEQAKSELAEGLAKTQREAAEARREVEACTVSLNTAQTQLEALTEERTQLLQERDEAARRLDAERRERMALAEALEAARQAVDVARASSDKAHDEVEAAGRYALAMEEGDAAAPSGAARAVARDVPQPYSGPTRAAHRVAMPEGSEVVVDSSVCLLVNLSTQGAQIRSRRAMRPNHVARILLPRGEGTLPCKGRIVWAVFEMPHAGDAAMYRAGVQFTEVDRGALNAFLLRQESARSPRTTTL